MLNIEQVDGPPPIVGHRGKPPGPVGLLAEKAAANPGQWFRVDATNIAPATDYYRKKGFQVVTRTVDGVLWVYMMWPTEG